MPNDSIPANFPVFTYHPNPLRSGSIVPSDAECLACGRARGFVYDGPVYAEEDGLQGRLCPWCIADGSAHDQFDATFVDSEAFDGDAPDDAIDEICERTPGFATWQSEQWPVCCDDATAFHTPIGIAEIRAEHRELEGVALNHIIYDLEISGGAATRMLDSLHRDKSPTAYLFQCLTCEQYHVRIDHL